jgi:chitin deacetylase
MLSFDLNFPSFILLTTKMIAKISICLLALIAFAFTVEAHPTRLVNFEKRQNNNYPPAFAPADPKYLPQDWKDALAAAQAAGKIPNIPQSTVDANGLNVYPQGHSPQEICSWTTTKCYGPNDVKQAPDGSWIVGFDDGPTNVSPDLYNFLHSQNQSAVHFMIGSAIQQLPSAVKQAASNGQELAVHTWSHNLMTTLSNEVILGELGWTMQLIYDLTGLLPTSWRPPQGDNDARVRAIAENVFGLKAVMWDAECNDWCLNGHGGSACPNTVPGKDYASVVTAVQQAIQRPKSPGVILLEHELTTESVQIFKDAYPQIKAAGWKTQTLSEAIGKDWYANAKDGFTTPTPVKGMIVSENHPASSSSSSSTSTTPTSSTTSSSSTTTTSPTSSTTTNTTANPPKGNALHTSGTSSTFISPLISLAGSVTCAFAAMYLF